MGAIGIIVGLLVGKWRCEQSAGIGISTQGLTLKLFVKLCPHRLNFFYFQGGINYDKMGFIPRSMLRMVGNTLEKKENKTEAEVDMAQIFSSSFDKTDKKYIEPLVACVNGL